MEWVDCCKGICILLVVYGHIAGGVEQSKVFGRDSVFAVLRDWVYLFHIPAFFFLSGLFARRASDRPFLPFLRGRARALAYPYVVWTVIFVAAQAAMARFVNTPVSISRALCFLWEPYGVGLWFLYALFLSSLYFYGLRRVRLPTIASLLIVTAMFVMSQRKVFGFWYILNESMVFAVYFVIGGCFPQIATASIKWARWQLWLAALFLLAIMTLSTALPTDSWGLLKLLRALLGVAGVVCVAMAMRGTALAASFAFLGTYSLEVYLAHPLWGTFARGIFLRLGVHAPAVFVLGGVMLGVVGSLAMALASQRLDFPYLFRWPAKKTDTASAGTAASVGQAS